MESNQGTKIIMCDIGIGETYWAIQNLHFSM